MRVAVRVDASQTLGTGHVMRCLTLASKLRERGAAVLFICREHPGHLCDVITRQGFTVHRLSLSKVSLEKDAVAPEGEGTLGASLQVDAEQTMDAILAWGAPVNLLVVDHYAIGRSWERVLRRIADRLLVIDDLADRQHTCDVLLDQNLHDSPTTRYAGLLDASTRVFVGPQFALLRPEFERFEPRCRNAGLQRLHVFFGGTDPSGETLKVLTALRALGKDAPQTCIVLGPVHPRALDIREAAVDLGGVKIVEETNEMARLMLNADLGIGTCGGAAWERCALGLPSLVVVNAPNQSDDARILHGRGAIRDLGDAWSASAERWLAEILDLLRNPAKLMNMSRAAAAVMSGRKAAMQELEAALGC